MLSHQLYISMGGYCHNAEVDEAVEAILDNAANEAIDSDNEANVAETADNPTTRQS